MKIAFNIARGIVLLFSLFFLVFGLQWLFVPQNLAEGFALVPNGILGLATLRADLGAMFLVTGITAAFAASNMNSANTFLLCCCLLMVLAAFGRFVGFVMDGVPEGGIGPFIFELMVAASLVAVAVTRNRLKESETNE